MRYDASIATGGPTPPTEARDDTGNSQHEIGMAARERGAINRLGVRDRESFSAARSISFTTGSSAPLGQWNFGI